MKIGIITFWESNDNYGQLLQCFALQKYLRNMGHSPFLIRYRDNVYKSSFKFSKIFTYISHFRDYFEYFKQIVRNERYKSQNNSVDRKFEEFRASYLTMTPNIFDSQTIVSNIPEADAFICGSDQIWGGSHIYYLSFVPDDKLKIAYAPSFGGTNPFLGSDKYLISKLLNRFDFIGMREKSGTEILKENGIINSTQVVDPTLLLGRDEYISFLDGNPECIDKPKKEAFIYLLGSPIKCDIKDVIKYVDKLGLSYIYVASQGRVDSYKKSPLTIPQWINCIKNSQIVITNSFHCVVFSLIFHKPFIFLPLTGSFSRMNDRVNDLLLNSGLHNQICNNRLEDISMDLDFTKFDEFKFSQVNKTDNYLKNIFKC